MKVRIKHTEKIIDVEWSLFGWISEVPEGKRIFNTEELDFLDNDNFDWQSFRAKAAKDILCTMIPKENNIIGKDLVGYSIMIADELIKQLIEKEEK